MTLIISVIIITPSSATFSSTYVKSWKVQPSSSLLSFPLYLSPAGWDGRLARDMHRSSDTVLLSRCGRATRRRRVLLFHPSLPPRWTILKNGCRCRRMIKTSCHKAAESVAT